MSTRGSGYETIAAFPSARTLTLGQRMKFRTLMLFNKRGVDLCSWDERAPCNRVGMKERPSGAKENLDLWS